MPPLRHDSHAPPSVHHRAHKRRGRKTLIGLKHTAKTSAGLPVTTTWVDMPPEDVERLIKTLQDTLAELGRE